MSASTRIHMMWVNLREIIMNIGYFLYILLSKETQHDTYLNPYSEFILIS